MYSYLYDIFFVILFIRARSCYFFSRVGTYKYPNVRYIQ